MLTCMRRDDDALACLNHALHLSLDYDKARFNLGYLWMRQGRWDEGFLCSNESRDFPAVLQAKLDLTRWSGDSLAGRSLLIGVDTSMVHVAGALGKPVWVLLSDYKTDWRWLNARSESPRHLGVMRLFRQDAGGRRPASGRR